MKCDVCKQNIATLNRCRDCNSIMMNVVKEDTLRNIREIIDDIDFDEIKESYKPNMDLKKLIKDIIKSKIQ